MIVDTAVYRIGIQPASIQSKQNSKWFSNRQWTISNISFCYSSDLRINSFTSSNYAVLPPDGRIQVVFYGHSVSPLCCLRIVIIIWRQSACYTKAAAPVWSAGGLEYNLCMNYAQKVTSFNSASSFLLQFRLCINRYCNRNLLKNGIYVPFLLILQIPIFWGVLHLVPHFWCHF